MSPVDVRLEIDRNVINVIDGFCNANGKCRNKVINEILLEWANNKRHEATLICRVAGINPVQSEVSRT